MQFITHLTNHISWDQLKHCAVNGVLDEVLCSGDRFMIRLNNDRDAVIVATKDQSGKWYFLFQDCLDSERRYNVRNTTEGGWRDSIIRRWMNSDGLALLPNELREIIIPARNVQVLNGERIITQDMMFLPSYTQVFGGDRFAEQEPEDSKLEYFETFRERIAGRNGVPACWWLRSVFSGTVACFVHGYGSAGGNGAGGSYGVRPLSLIG